MVRMVLDRKEAGGNHSIVRIFTVLALPDDNYRIPPPCDSRSSRFTEGNRIGLTFAHEKGATQRLSRRIKQPGLNQAKGPKSRIVVRKHNDHSPGWIDRSIHSARIGKREIIGA